MEVEFYIGASCCSGEFSERTSAAILRVYTLVSPQGEYTLSSLVAHLSKNTLTNVRPFRRFEWDETVFKRGYSINKAH